jgi:hypothetical protein
MSDLLPSIGAQATHGEGKRGDQRAYETLPHGLVGEIVTHLLDREQDSTDRRTKGDGDARSASGRQDLPHLG